MLGNIFKISFQYFSPAMIRKSLLLALVFFSLLIYIFYIIDSLSVFNTDPVSIFQKKHHILRR